MVLGEHEEGTVDPQGVHVLHSEHLLRYFVSMVDRVDLRAAIRRAPRSKPLRKQTATFQAGLIGHQMNSTKSG